MNLQATLFPTLTDPKGRPLDWGWATFTRLLADPPPAWQAPDRLHLPLVKLGRYQNNTRAEGSPLVAITGVEVDHDDGTTTPEAAAEMLKVAGIRAVVVTTARHAPALPRWRAFAPLSRVYQPEQRAALVARLNGVLGACLAPESFTQKQVFFVGRLRDSPHYTCIPVDGECVDTLDELDDGAIGVPQREPSESPDEDARAVALAGNRASWPDNALVLLSALRSISSACTYKVWMEVGAAFFYASGGHSDAMLAWLEWSATSPGQYPGDDAAKQKWRDFGQLTAYSTGTLYHHAHAAGWHQGMVHKVEQVADKENDGQTNRTPVVSVEDCLNNWVWLSNQEMVVLREESGTPIMRWPAVVSTYAASQMLPPSGVVIRQRKKTVDVVEVWRANPQRAAAFSGTYAPGMPPFCLDPLKRKCYNLWAPVPRTKPKDASLVGMFLAHIEYLVPNAKQREWFLMWLAHCEQRPEELPMHHWLMVTRAQGVGRNWLASLLNKVWPLNVAMSVNLLQMFKSGFNDDIVRKTFAVVDEISVSGTAATRDGFATAFKALLTEEFRQANIKYGMKSVEFNRTRWLLFSNSESALPIPQGDRRLNVVRNPGKPMDAGYYSMLYGALMDDDFVNAVGWYLRTLDISTFNPGARAEMSEMKKVVQSASRDDVQNAVNAFCEQWPSAVAPVEALRDFVTHETGVHRDKLRYVAKLVKETDAEVLPDRMRVLGEQHPMMYVLLTREHDTWREAPTADKIKECMRGINMWSEKHMGPTGN